MKFLHISDTHFLRDYSSVTDGFVEAFLDMRSPIEQLKEVLDMVEEDYDVVIHSGDLVHTKDLSMGCDQEYENIKQEYVVLKQELEAIFSDKLLMVTPGNHDNKRALKEVFCPLEDPEKDLVYYKVLGDVLMISVDTTSKPQSGAVTKETCYRVQKILVEHKEKKAILFTHHHLLEEQFELPGALVDQAFGDILNTGQVMAVITGHTHHIYSGSINGVDYFSGESLSFVVDNEAGDLNIYECAGVQVCTINPKGITVRNHSSEKRKIGVLSI